ncbi:flagellar hook-length control protein FliK [Paracoccus benzoatiresistens]|uniref:Flagellar hook-length control protein FliK n=1 Tax=Paracoccus benzoatiresistens TaxID=2997341 RepID=A0ABT4J4K4_9RHOB|nr:flagellar hook-length control protein FliK [Paracoccus sp. EF6]MCZ0962055.1 flagellar hook-length control protein FliK [Paracoccus sp. EF6]
MAECIVLPVVTFMQPVALAEPAAEGEQVAACFTLEDAPPEEAAELAEAKGDPAAPTPDPLQMLIEDLSGITGALRETGLPPDDAAVAEAEVMPERTRATLLPAPLEVPSLDTPSTDMAPIEPPLADADVAKVEPLLSDPAAPPVVPAARDEAVAHAPAETAAEPRPAKLAIVPAARQIAEAVVTARDDVVEIALSPEELGRVRMVLSGPDHSPHVVVWAERPEILDQLRRNAAILQEFLGDAGMPDASFEFQGDIPSDSRGGHPMTAASDRPALAAAVPVQSVPVAWTPMAIPARLDIRI